MAYTLTEADSCTVYDITEAKIASYSKIYERLLIVSVTIYLAIPGILEFQASQLGTRTIAYMDVGMFNDL